MGMDLYRKIRKLLGATKYRMAHNLRITEAHYRHFEGAGKRVTLPQLVALWELSGLSVAKFWALIVEEAMESDANRPTKPRMKESKRNGNP